MAEIDLGSTYPEAEDIILAFNRSMAIIREETTNIEFLFKKLIEGKTYISDEECANILRCKVSEIPAALERYRPSKSYHVFKVADVFQFIEDRKIKGK